MLGDNIVKIRKLKGMSAAGCAKKIGISRGYYHDIENNIKKNPSMEMLGRIALVLGVTTSELLSTEEKLELALGSLNEIDKTIEQYYMSKSDISNNELQTNAETNVLINKIKKLSNKERKIVEALIDQILKEE